MSNWRLTADRFELETVIPANTTAKVFLPTANSDKITANGKPLAKAKGVQFLRMEGDRSVLAIEPGSYRFVSRCW